MKQADLADLANVVRTIVGGSPMANRFQDVEVEAGDYDKDNDFIRVNIHLARLSEISDEDMDMISARIEGEISARDDRFPSVRFSES